MDFQDLATGLAGVGGGVGGWRGVKGSGTQQSCPLTFNFVPTGLSTWYTYVLVLLLLFFV